MTLPERSSVTVAQVEAWFKQHIAELTCARPEDIRSDADFESYGIDSLQAVNMMVALEAWLAMPDELPMELLFEAPSIADAARGVTEAKKIQLAQS